MKALAAVGADFSLLDHLSQGAPAPFAPPDVIVQLIDAPALERHLELTLELLQLGRPLVVARNKTDEARDKGLHVGTNTLARRLGVAVVPTAAAMGYGIGMRGTARVVGALAGDATRTEAEIQDYVQSLLP